MDREAVRTRPCVSRVWWPHSPAERTRRHRPRRGPGLAPRPGQAGPPPPTGLGMKRMGDITYIRARGGICLSGNRPRAAAPRKVVGYAMVDSMRYRSWYARRSIWRPAGARRGERRRSSTPGRGSQYTSEQLARHLKGYGTRPSVGRTGVRWAGAWAESFNATLKERKSPRRWSTTTRRKAINDIASRVEPGTQVRHVSTQRSGTGRPTRPNTILQAVTKPPDQHNQPQSETRPAVQAPSAGLPRAVLHLDGVRHPLVETRGVLCAGWSEWFFSDSGDPVFWWRDRMGLCRERGARMGSGLRVVREIAGEGAGRSRRWL